MPAPPNIPFFAQMRFVTNYMLAGCGPEQGLIVEMNTLAAKNLAVILFGISAEDIVQGFFDPRRGRNTKPDRHGRKRRGGFRFPDISDEIGRRASVPEIGQAMRQMPFGKWVLPGINVLEGIAISTIIVEGVGDITFDNIAGLLELNPEHCTEFERFEREIVGQQVIIKPGGGISPIFFDDEKYNVGFVGGRSAVSCFESRFAINIAIDVWNDREEFDLELALQLSNMTTGETAHTGYRTLAPGQRSQFTCNLSAEPGQYIAYDTDIRAGTGLITQGNVVGYGESGWLDWLPKFEIPFD